MEHSVLFYLLDFLLATLPAVGFAMLFATPVRYLPLVALGGGFTHVMRLIIMDFMGLHLLMATFWSVFMMSLIFIYIAPRIHVPRPVFTVASIIPIIPGKYAYTAILAAITLHDHVGSNDAELISEFMRSGLVCVGVMLCIGMGIALPPLLFYRNRPVV